MSMSVFTRATGVAVEMLLRIGCLLLSGLWSSFLLDILILVRLIHPENPCTSSHFKCFVPMPAGLCLPGTVLTWRVPSSTLLYPKSTLSAHVADLIRLRAPRLLLLMFCGPLAL